MNYLNWFSVLPLLLCCLWVVTSQSAWTASDTRPSLSCSLIGEYQGGTRHSYWLMLCVGVVWVQLVGVSRPPVSPSHSLSCFVILSVFILILIIMMISAFLLVSVATCLVSAKPTIYKVDEEKNIAESILTPVSSTGRILIEVNMKLNSSVCNLTLKVNISWFSTAQTITCQNSNVFKSKNSKEMLFCSDLGLLKCKMLTSQHIE